MASLDFIPGVKEAEARFHEEQLEAFAGIEPEICGCFSPQPLTPQIYLELSGADNGFFNSGTVTPVDVAVFLWRVSPGFKRDDKELRKTFNQFISVLSFDQAVTEILEYIRRSLAPMPQWPGSDGPTSAGVWPSRIVDLFASEYGWSEEYTLNMPFRRLWQYANRILERKNDKYTHKCPEELALRSKWLEETNRVQTGAN
jgi:hypothetical protein